MTRTAWFLIGVMTLASPSAGRGQALDLDAAVDSITVRLSEQVGGAGSLRVATSELLDSAGNPNELGRFIGDRLAVSLTARAEFLVIGRRELEQALDQLGLEIAGLVEPAKAAEACALLNCNAVLAGRISEVGDEIEVTVRMVDVDNERVLEEITELLRKNAVVEDLLRRKQRPGAERPDQADAAADSGTASAGTAEWPSITTSRLEFTLAACPFSKRRARINLGLVVACHLVVTNNRDRQDWIRVFEIGTYVSDAEGIRLQLAKVYGLRGWLRDGFYHYSAMLPRSQERPVVLLLEFRGSEELGDVTSVVIRVDTPSSAAVDLEFKRITPHTEVQHGCNESGSGRTEADSIRNSKVMS